MILGMKRVNYYMDESILAWVERFSRDSGFSEAEIVRRAVRAYLREHDPKVLDELNGCPFMECEGVFGAVHFDRETEDIRIAGTHPTTGGFMIHADTLSDLREC